MFVLPSIFIKAMLYILVCHSWSCHMKTWRSRYCIKAPVHQGFCKRTYISTTETNVGFIETETPIPPNYISDDWMNKSVETKESCLHWWCTFHTKYLLRMVTARQVSPTWAALCWWIQLHSSPYWLGLINPCLLVSWSHWRRPPSSNADPFNPSRTGGISKMRMSS